MTSGERKLRIGLVQYDPKITEVDSNMSRIRSFLKDVPKGSLDLLCLPETALTGYVFPTPEDVLPYLEEPKTGPTSRFVRELSQQLGCPVVAGYPEKLSEEELQARTGDHRHAVGANSAIVYDGNGEYVGGYRKTNMFDADLPWVKPGTGFASFTNLPSSLQNLSLGICMDLNPLPKEITEWPMPCELASYALSRRSRVLVLLRAWLQSDNEIAPSSPWNMSTIQFWLERLLPLWSKDSPDLRPMREYPAPEEEGEEHDETIVVICNRTGEERGSTFAGCSLVVKCSRSKGKWDIVGLVDKKFEGLAVWDVE